MKKYPFYRAENKEMINFNYDNLKKKLLEVELAGNT